MNRAYYHLALKTMEGVEVITHIYYRQWLDLCIPSELRFGYLKEPDILKVLPKGFIKFFFGIDLKPGEYIDLDKIVENYKQTSNQ